MSEPRVLFVSKPIAPPWNDGSKNLVRDVAANLKRARPTVMTVPGAPDLGAGVARDEVYRDSGRFAPAVTANARVALRLAAGKDPHDIWHFVFAPNPMSSMVARIASRGRRTVGWQGKIVQTVASAPRTFDLATRVIFGDVVVALSEHTRGRLIGAGVRANRLRVISPCARAPGTHDAATVRTAHALGDGPIVLYPGDYEVSRGAETVAAAVAEITKKVPEALVVFACRKKTPAADEAQKVIEKEIARVGLTERTRHLGEVKDMSELLAVTSVVAFPVDDLYGKVDIPLVLLEAMALGLPVVVADGGPLETLTFAPSIEPGDDEALAAHVVDLLRDEKAAHEVGQRGKRMYDARFTPAVVAAAYDDLYSELL